MYTHFGLKINATTNRNEMFRDGHMTIQQKKSHGTTGGELSNVKRTEESQKYPPVSMTRGGSTKKSNFSY
jgi:hypothetical protein